MSENGDRIPRPKTKREQVEIDKLKQELESANQALRVLTDMSDEALRKAFTNTRAELEKPIREKIDGLRKKLGLK